MLPFFSEYVFFKGCLSRKICGWFQAIAIFVSKVLICSIQIFNTYPYERADFSHILKIFGLIDFFLARRTLEPNIVEWIFNFSPLPILPLRLTPCVFVLCSIYLFIYWSFVSRNHAPKYGLLAWDSVFIVIFIIISGIMCSYISICICISDVVLSGSLSYDSMKQFIVFMTLSEWISNGVIKTS